MRKIPNTKMKLLTDLQYRYDYLKSLNLGKVECSNGRILDLDLTDALQSIEELIKLLIEDTKPEVLTIDLGRIPKDFDLDKCIKEFKQISKEWSQSSLNSFMYDKFQIINKTL
jgi:hypothetical protein